MEILIPGLILVALMVYASTRIKRNAAAAFNAETIETDEFVIQKPEGFLHNLNGDPKFEFEAYSKGFSELEPKFRRGTATVIKIPQGRLDDLAAELVSAGNVTGNEQLVLDGKHYRDVRVDKSNDGVLTKNSYKLVEADTNVFQLEIVAVEEAADEPWIETFFDSFRVK